MKNCRSLLLTESLMFDVALISTAMSKLSLGKAAGLDQLSAENFIHNHPV
jgi:hypothetical protein